jgi:NAD-reducing hydrogenase large subunit
VLEQQPELARDGIRLRQIGQTVIETLGGKRIHPSWIVPGGVSARLTIEDRDKILSMLPEALEIGLRTLTWFKTVIQQFEREIESFARFPTLFLGLVDPQGNLDTTMVGCG